MTNLDFSGYVYMILVIGIVALLVLYSLMANKRINDYLEGK
jgi:hypothetical protein